MPPIQEYFYIASIIQAIFCVLTSIFTLTLLYISLKINVSSLELTKSAKMADTFAEFNRRFGLLWQTRANPNVIADPMVFYEQFWVLQHDQFQAWRDGFVNDEVFFDWAQVRYDDWQGNRCLGAVSYREGFERATERWTTRSAFDAFIEEVHAFGIDRAKLRFGQNTRTKWFRRQPPTAASVVAPPHAVPPRWTLPATKPAWPIDAYADGGSVWD